MGDTPYHDYLRMSATETCQYCVLDREDDIWHCGDGWGIQGKKPCSQQSEFICPLALERKYCKTEQYIETHLRSK